MDPCWQLAAKHTDLKALQATVDAQQSYIKTLHTTVLQMRKQLQALQSSVDALRSVAPSSKPSKPSPKPCLRPQAPQRSTSKPSSANATSIGMSTIELNLIDALRQAPAPPRARSVSPTTRARFRKNGVCVRCGGKGHWVASCPFQPYQVDQAQDHTGFVRTVQQLVGRGSSAPVSSAPSGPVSSTSPQVIRQPANTIDVSTLKFNAKPSNPCVRSTPSTHKAQYRLEGHSVHCSGENTGSRQESRREGIQEGSQVEKRLRYWAKWAAEYGRPTEGKLWWGEI
jgi:hypothetical protein